MLCGGSCALTRASASRHYDVARVCRALQKLATMVGLGRRKKDLVVWRWSVQGGGSVGRGRAGIVHVVSGSFAPVCCVSRSNVVGRGLSGMDYADRALVSRQRMIAVFVEGQHICIVRDGRDADLIVVAKKLSPRVSDFWERLRFRSKAIAVFKKPLYDCVVLSAQYGR
nr:hypothetical protein Iba_chr04dCG16510 [Ipomoea batatas]